MKKMNSSDQTNIARRKVLVWTPPLVAMVALPAHAQTSMCGSSPVVVANVASKCSGNPPIGQAVLTISSDAADAAVPAIEITAINAVGGSADDSFTVPTLPATVSDTVTIDVEWTGPATDATTCLPLADVTLEVTYSCDGVVSEFTAEFDVTAILTDAIP